MKRNYFIVLEGIDGCGKDTQLYKLVEAIREGIILGDKYTNIWVTREPTKITESGKKISELLKTKHLSLEDATKLFIEDRKEHSKIIKEILKHSFVISSRYDISTLTYQTAQGGDLDKLIELHNYNKDVEEGGCIVPDLTIIFKISPEIAFERTHKRYLDKSIDIEYFETLDFQKKIVSTQEKCINKLRKTGRKIIEVNGEKPIEEVTSEMITKIKEILK